jgi:3-hydroxyacyl-[acyl-carrier-protein] dehydratase
MEKTMTSSSPLTPHGPGFRFVDSIQVIEPGKKIIATLWLNPELPFFKDHFPGNPLMPGVLLIEAGAQSAGCAWGSAPHLSHPEHYFLARVLQFSIRAPALPHQTLTIQATLERDFGNLGQFQIIIHESHNEIAQGVIILSRSLQHP